MVVAFSHVADVEVNLLTLVRPVDCNPRCEGGLRPRQKGPATASITRKLGFSQPLRARQDDSVTHPRWATEQAKAAISQHAAWPVRHSGKQGLKVMRNVRSSLGLNVSVCAVMSEQGNSQKHLTVTWRYV
jgi:hypothetical protein